MTYTEGIKTMIKGLLTIENENLKKSDRRAFSTLYLYWLENGKKKTFDLPLFVDDNGKGVMSVEAFKRVFYAFCLKINMAYDCHIKSGTDGNESSYNVVRLSLLDSVKTNSVDWLSNFDEPKKADVKRESSKVTAEKAEAKKAEAEKKQAEAEAESNKQWNSKASKKLLDLVCGKYGLKLSAEKYADLEKDIVKILETTM